MLPDATINYWAVLVSVIGSMAIGYVWYSMPVFGRMWMNLIGKTEAELKGGAGPAMGIAVIYSFFIAYVFAHVIDYTGAATAMDGITAAFWIWLGLPFAVIAMQNLFSMRPFKLTIINSGYHLIQLVLMGILFAVWK
jgi:hypothetical protein